MQGRNNSNQFSIYLRVETSSQWPVTESARIQTTGIWQHMTKQRRNNKGADKNKEK
jgi:hypothetical protein